MIISIFLVIVYLLVGLLIALIRDRQSTFGIHFDYAMDIILLWPISILGIIYDKLRRVNRKQKD